jgi:hypothetical protein
LKLATTPEAIAAVAELNQLLRSLPEAAAMPAASLSPAVDNFRTWLVAEVGAQLAGRRPRTCPLPDR